MRIKEQTRDSFWRTHKGGEITIKRDDERPGREFYIQVRYRDGGLLYDGCAPEGLTTIAEAKKEAVRGACLDEPM